MAKCKSWKALVVVHKEVLPIWNGKAQTLEQQAEDLSVSHRAAEMLEGSQLRQACYAEDRALENLCCELNGVPTPPIYVLKL